VSTRPFSFSLQRYLATFSSCVPAKVFSEPTANSLLAGVPDKWGLVAISNNVGSVKHILSALLCSLRRVVFFAVH
jgi:hypothetical protein